MLRDARQERGSDTHRHPGSRPAVQLQIAQRTRTSDNKTVILVRGNLTAGVLASVSVGGLDADKAFSLVVEQVAARQNSTDVSRSYVQRTTLTGYTASIK